MLSNNALFSTPYPTFTDSCRAFCRAAEAVKAKVLGFGGFGARRGLQNEELLTLATYKGPRNPHGVLCVMSGNHGAELWAGSLIQTELLGLWGTLIPQNVGLLLIHAANPYGSSYVTRCDENNVDPNRANWSLPRGEAYPTPKEYYELHPYINPTSLSWWTKQQTLFAVYRKKWECGLPKLKRIIGSGQGAFNTGVFYAGDGRPTHTNITIRRVLRTLLPGSTRFLMLFDVHTGIGPCGIPTLLNHFPRESEEGRLVYEWLGEDLIQQTEEADSVATHSPGVIENVFKEELEFFSGCKLAALCMELGTVDLAEGAWTVCKNNAMRHHGPDDPGHPLHVESRGEMYQTFYPLSSLWRTMVVTTTMGIFTSGLTALSHAR